MVNFIAAFIMGMALLLFAAKFKRLHSKVLIKIGMHSIAGLLLVFLINVLGTAFNIPWLQIEISMLSGAVAGVLGVPGVVILFIFSLLV